MKELTSWAVKAACIIVLLIVLTVVNDEAVSWSVLMVLAGPRLLKFIQDEARNLFGIQCLAERIRDLRNSGFHIVGDRETGFNRYGDKCHWTRYRLDENDAS